MKWYKLAIQQYATFTGRTSREGYWMFVLMNILFSIGASILDLMMGTRFDNGGGIVSGLYNLFVLIPSLAIGVRRLHDIGKSGWLLAIVSIVSVVVLLIMVFSAFMSVLMSGSDDLPTGGAAAMVLCGMYFLGVGIWMLVLFCRKGTPGVNKWGPNPEETEANGYDTMGESI